MSQWFNKGREMFRPDGSAIIIDETVTAKEAYQEFARIDLAQGVTVKELRSELSMIDPRKKYYGDDLQGKEPFPSHYPTCGTQGCSATRCPTFMMGL